MTLGYGDLKKGMAIELEGVPYIVVEYERSKMQQRAPVMRIRLKDLRTGRAIDRTFQGYDVKLIPAPVEHHTAQYIYEDGPIYYFMDTDNFEQFPLTEEQLGDALKYLAEELTVDVLFYKGEAVAVELPNSVNLKVTETPPGVRGDTAQGGTKPATLETGITIQVPLFVNEGDVVKVDTRTGQYLARA